MPEPGTGADWRRLALTPLRAHGEALARGLIRAEPEDFEVEERLGFEPDGGAAHCLLWIEKRDVPTPVVARALAESVGCRVMDVGFAGIKDRRAVARQWYSVPAAPGRVPAAGAQGRGFRVLAAHPHSRKLRRGSLAGNAFRLRVRVSELDPAGLDARMTALAASGFPNYFGPQRFGAGAGNLDRIREWLDGGQLPRGRDGRSFLLSSARALAFNAVLERRIATASWNRLLAGEIVSLAGSASVFATESVDATLEARCRAGDVAPSGPLCGVGGLCPIADAGRVEALALESVAPIPATLTAAGLRGDRRPLVVRPRQLRYRLDAPVLQLEFELPRGSYATCLLRELFDVELPEPGPD